MIVVLLGVLALYLSHLQLYVQLGMPAFSHFLGCALLTFRLHGRYIYGGPVTITDSYTPDEQH
jgi:hypothetical protein